MVDDSGGGGEPGGDRGGILHRPEVVGDDAAVRARRHVAELDLAEAGERRVKAVGEELQGDRRRDRLDEFVGGGDDDEAVGRGGDDLLARVRGAAALYDTQVYQVVARREQFAS